MKDKTVVVIAILLITTICSVWMFFSKSNNETPIEMEKQTNTTKITSGTSAVKYPITDAWVFRYNPSTQKSDFAPCGYIDSYTSLVKETDKTLSQAITGTYMYLGKIKGYQNEDKTMRVYQVTLLELGENFTLTNKSIVFDYSGKSKMIEVDGWIYMDGTTIVAVSPLYAEKE